MKKQYQILIAIIVIIAVSLSFVLGTKIKSAESDKNFNCEEAPGDQLNPYSGINSCYRQKAISEEDSQVCANAKSDYMRDYCYEQYAETKGDFSACSYIKSASEKDSCYMKTGIVTGNVEICDMANVEYSKYYCYAVVKNNPAYCAEIQGEYEPVNADWCYLQFAYYSDDISICEKIENSQTKEACKKYSAMF